MLTLVILLASESFGVFKVQIPVREFPIDI